MKACARPKYTANSPEAQDCFNYRVITKLSVLR